MPQVSDERLHRVVSVYAGLVGRVLDDPERWLGWGAEDVEDPSLRDRVRSLAASAVLGGSSPGAADWNSQPPTVRADWWVSRVATVAGFVAATPRFAGLAADRLPIQAAMGAAAQGLAVCAVAREYEIRDPDDWVPLLGKVLFARDLERGHADDAVREWAGSEPGTDDPDEQLAGDAAELVDVRPEAPQGLRRALRTLLRLASTFLAVHGMFDERPRGAFAFRALGKVPVVGLLGGWLDERGGVHKAARATEHLISRPLG